MTVIVYLIYRRYPQSWVKYVNVPIFFNAAGNIPPANTSQFAPSYHPSIRRNANMAQHNTRSGSFSDSCSTTSFANVPWLGGRSTTVSIPRPPVRRHQVLNTNHYSIDLFQAAMDTGTAIATIVIFFALGYTNTTFNWWGNTVGSNTDDQNSVPWLTVPAGGHFGKGPGEF